ncbi:MAG: putative dehydrogenase [Promethearchaeota archaeon]|nr:MAG: putative dehydrogenase [Candidatus Lokiarchaeota archaeon]
MEQEKIEIAIVGSGFIAEHHCMALNQIPEVNISSVYSRHISHAKELMNKYKISGNPVSSFEELLNLDLHAVSLCVPNYLHKEMAIKVLESGKHVFIEKPLAMNADEGQEIINVEKSSGKRVFYCENNIYAPTFKKVKEIINEGALGKIYMGRGKEQHSGPHSSWFYKRDKAGGGSLIDLGVHDIACLIWYLESEVERVFCQTRIIQPDRKELGLCEVEDNAVGILYFDNGAQVTIEESWTAPGGYDMGFELYGTEGQIKASPTFTNLVSVYSEKGYGYAVEKASSTQGWTFPVPDEGYTFGYPQEMKHFIDCIRNDKKPLTDGIYGLKVMKIIDAMYRSSESQNIEEVI